MIDFHPATSPVSRPSSPWLRQIVTVLFRHQRLIFAAFVVTALGAVAALMLTPKRYEAELKILIRRDRADPLLSPDPGTVLSARSNITEEDVNSEVDLLKSRDLLEEVASAAGLAGMPSQRWWQRLLPASRTEERQARLAQAVDALSKAIVVEPPRKSHLIRVSYRCSDPELAARVLNLMGEVYLRKHLAVHRTPGAAAFFQREAERFHRTLRELESRLAENSRNNRVVSAEWEKNAALQRLAQFEATLDETAAQVRAAEERIRELETQLSNIPQRNVTEIRTSTVLQQQLRSALYTLELKRTELLQKFAPGYRAVRDLESQIDRTRAALADAERSPLQEEVSDQNPTYALLFSDLGRARAELAGLRARQSALGRAAESFRLQAIRLQEEEKVQQELLRAIKVAEENYLLYTRKQEEARIGDELDQQRVANVAIAQAATPPAVPSSSPWGQAPLALLVAAVFSFGLAFVSDSVDPSFRTPEEVEQCLSMPVLGSVPHPDDWKRFGNGHSSQ